MRNYTRTVTRTRSPWALSCIKPQGNAIPEVHAGLHLTGQHIVLHLLPQAVQALLKARVKLATWTMVS
jgi:hypothetical protein